MPADYTEKAKVINDRTSWSDGFVYEKVMTPFQNVMNRALIKRVAGADKTVLEIGCGVGSLALMLADKCRYVVGVDFSSQQIAFAEKKKALKKYTNVEFIHADASQLNKVVSQTFDFATMVMFLHEAEPELREKALREALMCAKQVMIADFVSPFPGNMASVLFRTMEYMAGVRRYRNFRNWMMLGGIDGFIKGLDVTVNSEIEWKNRCGKVVMISHKS
jgi:ubiquinone/menaquinone biosynthesis C-methylase UbiE